MAKESLLIVDDEQSILELCERILSKAGYQVTTASSGAKAVELARQQQFDLLLTDLKMPGLGGLETFQAVREIDPDIAGIVLTGFGTMETAIEALRLGFTNFILKPFTSDQLLQAVEEALESERLRRENTRLRALIPLYELSRAFMSTMDLDRLMKQVVELSQEATGADRCSLMLLDKESGTLTIRAAVGLPEEIIAGVHLQLGEGIAGWAAQTGEILLLNDPQEVPPEIRKIMVRAEIGSALCVPLKSQNQVTGVLNLTKFAGTPPFTEVDRDLVSILAGQVAIAIENARLFTEIQRAYEELKELDRLKSEFINIASHELRTPLAIISAYAELLEGETTEQGREFLKTLRQSAAQLARLTEDMVNLQHLERGELPLRMAQVSLLEILTEVVQRYIPLAEAKQQSFEVEVPTHLPAVRADPDKLELIVGNLCSNAVKFTPPGGHIRVSAEDHGNEVRILVADTGPGIPPEARERIFDRFYQVQESLTREHGGLGLGLSIVKGLVELHGGRVWVESEEGKGSTFIVSLPKENGRLPVASP
jgi:signal transduction histidine kinase